MLRTITKYKALYRLYLRAKLSTAHIQYFIIYRLTLFDGSKCDLAGFYDPLPTASGGDDDDDLRRLLVRYCYQGAVHEVCIDDEEALRIPRTAHRLGRHVTTE